jgi:flavodoxin
MKSLVLYATRKGNTARVAQAIADGLRPAGTVDIRSVDEAPATIGDEFDLVVIGGPTEGRHMTPQMFEYLERLPERAFAGVVAAAFDTRVDWPRWMSGSAAEGIRRELEQMGAIPPIETASFIVTMKPEILPEELERATAWAASLIDRVRATATTAGAAA